MRTTAARAHRWGEHEQDPEPAVVLAAPAPRALSPQHVARLQATAGNAAVVRLLRQPSSSSDILTNEGAAAAAANTNKVYSADSIRWIEALIGLTPDGSFTAADAERMAKTQRRFGLEPTGEIGEEILDELISKGAAAEVLRNQLLAIVVDRAGLDVSKSLEVEYDPNLTADSGLETFPGGVSRIKVGDSAFTSYKAVLKEIKKQLAVKPTASPTTKVPAATLKDPAKQQDAIAFNKARLPDPRSIRLVQGQTGSKATGQWDAETVRHVAARQQALGVPDDGKLDQATLEAMAAAMIQQGHQNALLHLIVDYYDLDRSHAFNVSYDPNQYVDPTDGSRANAQTKRAHQSMGVGGMVIMYPAAFSQPFAGLVHIVAHELGHVDQVMQGVASDNVREFLSECIEIESRGMPEEAIESAADITSLFNTGMSRGKNGFVDDSMTMFRRWQAMTTAERRQHVDRFRQIRTKILDRIRNQATQAQQNALKPFVLLLQAADQGL